MADAKACTRCRQGLVRVFDYDLQGNPISVCDTCRTVTKRDPEGHETLQGPATG